jgi:O-antigen/teichoic acid export membrane protein
MRRLLGVGMHLTGNLVPVMSGLVTAPMTARALGVEHRGFAAVFSALVGFMTPVASLGLGILVRTIAAQEYGQLHYWRGRARLVARFLVVPLTLFGYLLAVVFGMGQSQAAAAAAFMGGASWAAARAVDANVLVVSSRFKALSASNLVYSLGIVGSVIGLFVAGELTLVTLLLTNAFWLVVQTWHLSRLVREALPHTSDAIPIRRHSRDGQRRAWGAQVLDVATARGDTLMMAPLAGVHAIGLYSIVAIIPQLIWGMCATVVQRTLGDSSIPRGQLPMRISRRCVALALPLLALGLPVAYILIPIVFGAQYADARGYLVPAGAVSVGLAAFAGVSQFVATTRISATMVALGALFVGTASAISTAVDPRLGLSVFGTLVAMSSIAVPVGGKVDHA